MDPAIFHEQAWNESRRTRITRAPGRPALDAEQGSIGYHRAVAICASCPVRAQCLEYALTLPEVHGIFASLDPDEIGRRKT
jgi:hypothetical protein